MFSLIKFDNEEYLVLESKKVKIIQEASCCVKYKGASYGGQIIDTNDSRSELEKEKENASILPRPKNQDYTLPSFNGAHNSSDFVERISTKSNYLIENDARNEPIKKIDDSLTTSKLNEQNNTIPSFNESQNDLNKLEGIAFSTPTKDVIPTSCDENHYNYALNETTIDSSVPSGATEILNAIGDDWTNSNDNISLDKVTEHNKIDNDLGDESCGIGRRGLINDDALENPNEKKSFVEETVEKYSSINDDRLIIGESFVEETIEGQTTINETALEYSEYLPSGISTDITELSQNTPRFSGAKYSRDFPLRNKGETVDCRKLRIIPSKSTDDIKIPSKKHFCKYCKNLRSKFAEHLINMHKSEPEVKELLSHKPKSPMRLKLIAQIRNEGNYLHNTNPQYNTGIIITCRRPQKKFERDADDFVCCSGCLGMFSKNTLRIHHKDCNRNYKKGTKGQMAEGRDLRQYIHSRANKSMRTLFASFQNDDVSRLIRYDELLILHGNRLCDKYTLDHQQDMIRNYLRLLGRFTLKMKELNQEKKRKKHVVEDFASIFHADLCETIIEAIRVVAKYDDKSKVFKVPYNATTLATHIRKCSRLLITECIKKEDKNRQKEVENFDVVFKDEFPTVGRKVVEDMYKTRRDKQQQQVLPSKQDISILYNYLKRNGDEAMKVLSEKFEYTAWKQLNESSLILLQMFNRRRAGEIERLFLSNYDKKETIAKVLNADIYGKVSEKSQKQAALFVRVLIRGKKGRTVPVLIHKYLLSFINTIIKYREQAGVEKDNEYVFAVPRINTKQIKHLRACSLMRKFAEICGATIPSTLRGTNLRKHIATYTAMLGIKENEVSDLANFMGHADQIHKNIYRVPNGLKDMTEVSRLLMAAMEDDVDESDTDDEESSHKKQRESTKKTIPTNESDNSSDDEPQQSSAQCHMTPTTTHKRNHILQPDQHDQTETTDNVRSENDESNDEERKSATSTSRKRKRQMADSDDDMTPCSTSKSRNTSPYGKTKRIRWNEREKMIVKNKFGDVKLLKVMPTITECQELIANNAELHGRNAPALRSWIDNQRRAEVRRHVYRRRKLNLI